MPCVSNTLPHSGGSTDVPEGHHGATRCRSALSQLEDNFPEVRTSHFLPHLHTRVTYLNATIILAMDNNNGITLTNRTKRGFMNGIGQPSRMLFGTAMNEDVVELREQKITS